jgi:DNA-binding transcriptional MerR regulator
VAERAYLSIGDVLALLKEEFPDVTISKIRFLESQGLLEPERTPSGYRKFYEDDVARLRWILRQQREHFLPLKVIRDRLEEQRRAQVLDGAARAGAQDAGASSGGLLAGVPAPDLGDAGSAARGAGAPSPSAGGAAGVGGVPAPGSSEARAAAGVFDQGPSGVSLTFEELAKASGLGSEGLRELERYGLVDGRPVAGTVYYDEEALAVASLAAAFARFGIEARHLRMYKTAADREAGCFEQVITPLLKQRNPVARQRATETLSELSRLGQAMRQALLRGALRERTGG